MGRSRTIQYSGYLEMYDRLGIAANGGPFHNIIFNTGVKSFDNCVDSAPMKNNLCWSSGDGFYARMADIWG